MISESAATALGTAGTICWCIQLIPQVITNFRTKDCTGLPPIMLFLWFVSGIPFGIYACVVKSIIILQIQPHLFLFFCAVTFIQTLYYPPTQLPRRKIAAIIAGVCCLDVGMEVGFVLWLRPLYARGIHWPATFFGVLASVLLVIGLLPPYFELAKRQGRVVGLNLLFLAVDSMGAWLSLLSVIVGDLNVLDLVIYSLIGGLELGIFVSHFIWCCRFKWSGRLNDQLQEDEDTCLEAKRSEISQSSDVQDMIISKGMSEHKADNRKHEIIETTVAFGSPDKSYTQTDESVKSRIQVSEAAG